MRADNWTPFRGAAHRQLEARRGSESGVDQDFLVFDERRHTQFAGAGVPFGNAIGDLQLAKLSFLAEVGGIVLHIGDLDTELLAVDLQDGDVSRGQSFRWLALVGLRSPVDYLVGFGQVGRQRGRDQLLLAVDDVDRGRGIGVGPGGVALLPTGGRLTHVGVLAGDQIDAVLVEFAGDHQRRVRGPEGLHRDWAAADVDGGAATDAGDQLLAGGLVGDGLVDSLLDHAGVEDHVQGRTVLLAHGDAGDQVAAGLAGDEVDVGSLGGRADEDLGL